MELIGTSAKHPSIYYPVALECCYVGRKVRYLLAAIKGRGSTRLSRTGERLWNIKPTGVVAQRLVTRLADVLEGIQDPLKSLLTNNLLRGGKKVKEEPYSFFGNYAEQVRIKLASGYYGASYVSDNVHGGPRKHLLTCLEKWVASENERETQLRSYFIPELDFEGPNKNDAVTDASRAETESERRRKIQEEMYEQQRIFYQGGGVEVLVQ